MDAVNLLIKEFGKFLSTVGLTVFMPAGLLTHNTRQFMPELLTVAFVISDSSFPVLWCLSS